MSFFINTRKIVAETHAGQEASVARLTQFIFLLLKIVPLEQDCWVNFTAWVSKRPTLSPGNVSRCGLARLGFAWVSCLVRKKLSCGVLIVGVRSHYVWKSRREVANFREVRFYDFRLFTLWSRYLIASASSIGDILSDIIIICKFLLGVLVFHLPFF